MGSRYKAQKVKRHRRSVRNQIRDENVIPVNEIFHPSLPANAGDPALSRIVPSVCKYINVGTRAFFYRSTTYCLNLSSEWRAEYYEYRPKGV
jgi:hypothetical protein